jgi:hypothetical protein
VTPQPETMRRVNKHIKKQETKTGLQMTQIPIPDKYKYFNGGPKDVTDRFSNWRGERTHPKDETIIYSTT